jgi:hypothetical protein
VLTFIGIWIWLFIIKNSKECKIVQESKFNHIISWFWASKRTEVSLVVSYGFIIAFNASWMPFMLITVVKLLRVRRSHLF